MTPEKIKEIRKSLNMTQSQFGKLIGLEGDNIDVTVRRWEAGDRQPSSVVIRLLEIIVAGEMPKRYFE